MKHIIFTVTNDLVFDQRMHRICGSLAEDGYRCTLVGRLRNNSMSLPDRRFEQVRLRCWFDKGKLFYLEYNFRLFLFLMAQSPSIYCAVDLDTALPVYVVSRLRRRPFVFDAHEYFSELEEVISRPLVHRAWQWVERFIMSRFDAGYTISEGYARLFHERYGARFEVVRNVPKQQPSHADPESNVPYLIYQGALNMGRGLEASILAMHQVEGLELRIYGDGPFKDKLQALIDHEQLGHLVRLEGSLSPDRLRQKTTGAYAGLTLFSEEGLHHRHSLANRFFDYFHAEIPQIVIDHAEYKAFNDRYDIAYLIEEAQPKQIAEAIQTLQREPSIYDRLTQNCRRAIAENNWQLESQRLLTIYKTL